MNNVLFAAIVNDQARVVKKKKLNYKFITGNPFQK